MASFVALASASLLGSPRVPPAKSSRSAPLLGGQQRPLFSSRIASQEARWAKPGSQAMLTQPRLLDAIMVVAPAADSVRFYSVMVYFSFFSRIFVLYAFICLSLVCCSFFSRPFVSLFFLSYSCRLLRLRGLCSFSRSLRMSLTLPT